MAPREGLPYEYDPTATLRNVAKKGTLNRNVVNGQSIQLDSRLVRTRHSPNKHPHDLNSIS